MPPVIKTGAEKYLSRDRALSFATVKAQREAVILGAVRNYRPDVFLVDHAPAGMKGELLESLTYIREQMPGTLTVLGLRDIIDSPQAVCDLWREKNIYGLLETAYDSVLVYGSPQLFDVVREYKFPRAVSAKTRYCGYVTRSPTDSPAYHSGYDPQNKTRQPVVLVTAGGGGDGFPLLSAYLRALEAIPIGSAQSLIVPGPLMDDQDRHALQLAAAQRPDVQVIQFTTELGALINTADLVVSMAGYNTTAEILAAKKPAILVPRGAPRMEQRLRATLLSNLGLVWAIQPEEDLAARLAELIQAALAGARPIRKTCNAVDLGGAHRVGDILDQLLGLPRSVRGARI